VRRKKWHCYTQDKSSGGVAYGTLVQDRSNDDGHVHPAYNPSFSACFFSQNSVFLSQQISVFSAGLSAQSNGTNVGHDTAAPKDGHFFPERREVERCELSWTRVSGPNGWVKLNEKMEG
jgi:hypothetical protein